MKDNERQQVSAILFALVMSFDTFVASPLAPFVQEPTESINVGSSPMICSFGEFPSWLLAPTAFLYFSDTLNTFRCGQQPDGQFCQAFLRFSQLLPCGS
jgi:hypothetical protein